MNKYLFHPFNLSLSLSIVISAYIILNILTDHLIFNDNFFYRTFSDQMSIQNIDQLLSFTEKIWWFNYLFQPIYVLLKALFVVLCITTYSILNDIEFSLKNFFKLAVFAEVIFIVSHSIYFFNLYINRTTLTLETVANYFPLSLLSFYGVENVVSWLHYPIQSLNLFEVLYVLFISWLLSKQWKPNFVESLNIVLASYGIGLLLWMVLVVFLSLQIS